MWTTLPVLATLLAVASGTDPFVDNEPLKHFRRASPERWGSGTGVYRQEIAALCHKVGSLLASLGYSCCVSVIYVDIHQTTYCRDGQIYSIFYAKPLNASSLKIMPVSLTDLTQQAIVKISAQTGDGSEQVASLAPKSVKSFLSSMLQSPVTSGLLEKVLSHQINQQLPMQLPSPGFFPSFPPFPDSMFKIPELSTIQPPTTPSPPQSVIFGSRESTFQQPQELQQPQVVYRAPQIIWSNHGSPSERLYPSYPSTVFWSPQIQQPTSEQPMEHQNPPRESLMSIIAKPSYQQQQQQNRQYSYVPYTLVKPDPNSPHIAPSQVFMPQRIEQAKTYTWLQPGRQTQPVYIYQPQPIQAPPRVQHVATPIYVEQPTAPGIIAFDKLPETSKQPSAPVRTQQKPLAILRNPHDVVYWKGQSPVNFYIGRQNSSSSQPGSSFKPELKITVISNKR